MLAPEGLLVLRVDASTSISTVKTLTQRRRGSTAPKNFKFASAEKMVIQLKMVTQSRLGLTACLAQRCCCCCVR